ncbi:MAG: reverse transcriptase family protein, partial [Oscillospiraceae bacterium]
NMLDPHNCFNVFRCDRVNQTGGGVCVFISHEYKSRQISLKSEIIAMLNFINCDLVCFEFYVGNLIYRFILLYWPPSSTLTVESKRFHMHYFIKVLSQLIKPNLTTIVAGDFNLPLINWANNSYPTDGIHDLFIESVTGFGLNQMVLSPTRYTEHGTDSTLDLIFCTDPCAVVVSDTLPPFSTSDHVMVKFSTFFPDTNSSQNIQADDESIDLTIFDWSSGNYEAINAVLKDFDWHSLFGFYFDANSLWDQFKNMLWPVIYEFVPTKKVPHLKKYHLRNYPATIKKLLTRKAAIWRILKNNKTNHSLRLKYSDIAKQCKTAIFDYDLKKEKKIIESNNIGSFYKYVNSKLSSRSGIPPLINSEGRIHIDDSEKASLLSDYFASVFTTDNGIAPEFPSRIPSYSIGVDDVIISPSIIFKIVNKLKTNSACGPDNLPPIFYHNTAKSIAFPLAIIYRSFIDLHAIPDEWKRSIIIPKLKKGSPSEVGNYRPISLTCTACKVLESIISNDLLEYLNNHKLISTSQHGFLKNHSTSTNILSSLNDWSLSLHNHRTTAVGYIDFQRAFDSISHPKLIQKLISYGVKGNLLYWIIAFLDHRTQCVKINSSVSNYIFSASGVPQGSVLGPLLFNLFINDITDSLDSSVTTKLFADDVKIYSELTLPESSINFQKQFDNIHNWANTWQIGISYSKCNLIIIGHQSVNQNFTLSNKVIQKSDHVKDLGVTVDCKLNFKEHISNQACNARQRSALLFRSFLSRNPHSLIRAYKTYIRPILEYASITWSPSYIHLIDIIENVQKSFTRRLSGLNNFGYKERLEKLKLQSLEHRRLINDLVACHGIVHGLSSLQFDEFFKFSKSVNTRGHTLRLEIPLTKNNTRKHFFSSRVVKPWNSLSASIVNIKSKLTFKHAISKLDLSIYLKFPCNLLN